ncbi:MAG TPA: hypothetical protein VMK82_09830 [Steroidobacteraceae bacterium]|nr:hypothetical protein [Steroidobacteraceae bacterium]
MPVATAAALLIAGCDSPEPSVVNPDPVKIVRVHGDADVSLTISVSTQYQSTEKQCRDTAPIWVESAVARSLNSYEAPVAIDHFREDECRWQPFVIAFQVTNQEGLSTGRFVTGPQGTEHVPGPEGKVWISPAGGRRDTSGTLRKGAPAIRPLDLKCTVNVIRGARGLSCVPNSPRELPLISAEATEVGVDFEDVTGRTDR